jgi:tRNA nucleotidyltransferase (CCA-adding enzyme)
MVRFHDTYIREEEKAVRRAIIEQGEDIFPLLFIMRKADIQAQSLYRRQEKLDHLAKIQELYLEIIEKKDCINIKNLAISGKDLIQCGMKPGKEMGEVIDALFQVVLDHPESNTKEFLVDYYIHNLKKASFAQSEINEVGEQSCL